MACCWRVILSGEAPLIRLTVTVPDGPLYRQVAPVGAVVCTGSPRPVTPRAGPTTDAGARPQDRSVVPPAAWLAGAAAAVPAVPDIAPSAGEDEALEHPARKAAAAAPRRINRVVRMVPEAMTMTMRTAFNSTKADLSS